MLDAGNCFVHGGVVLLDEGLQRLGQSFGIVFSSFLAVTRVNQDKNVDWLISFKFSTVAELVNPVHKLCERLLFVVEGLLQFVLILDAFFHDLAVAGVDEGNYKVQ